MRRAGPRMSQHEHGFVVELLVPHRAAVKEPVAQREEGVQDGHARDEEQAGPVRELSTLRPCLHNILAHCAVVMPLRGWFLTLQKSRGRWSMMPRGGKGGIIPQTGGARARRRLMMTGHPSSETREEVRISTRAFSSNLGTRVLCTSRGRLRAKGRGRWGVTGERRKLEPSQPAGPVKARRRPDDSKNLFCRMRHRGRPCRSRNPGSRPHPPWISSRLLSTRRLRRRRSPSRFCDERRRRRVCRMRHRGRPCRYRNPGSRHLSTRRLRRRRSPSRFCDERRRQPAPRSSGRSRDGDVRLSVTFQEPSPVQDEEGEGSDARPSGGVSDDGGGGRECFAVLERSVFAEERARRDLATRLADGRLVFLQNGHGVDGQRHGRPLRGRRPLARRVPRRQRAFGHGHHAHGCAAFSVQPGFERAVRPGGLGRAERRWREFGSSRASFGWE